MHRKICRTWINVVFSFQISYRAIVLRALPNIEMLDNVSVTQEELSDAMKGGQAVQSQEEIYEDAYSNGGGQQQPPQQQPQQPQQQYRQQSPIREVGFIAFHTTFCNCFLSKNLKQKSTKCPKPKTKYCPNICHSNNTLLF